MESTYTVTPNVYTNCLVDNYGRPPTQNPGIPYTNYMQLNTQPNQLGLSGEPVWATNSPSIVPITTGFTHTNPVSTAPGQFNQIPAVRVEYSPPVGSNSPVVNNQNTSVFNPNLVGDIYQTTGLTVSHPEAPMPANSIETDCSNAATTVRPVVW